MVPRRAHFCVLAFARAAQVCPDIDLYGPDRHHASPAGSYLVALSVLRGVFGRDVLGLPGRIGFAGRPVLDLPQAQAAALQAVASFLFLGRRKAADFFQNLRLGKITEMNIIPIGNPPVYTIIKLFVYFSNF